MATKPSVHIAGPVSPQLASMVRALTADSIPMRRLTLSQLRNAVVSGSPQWSPEGELLYLQDRTSLVVELDKLITRYGADALVD